MQCLYKFDLMQTLVSLFKVCVCVCVWVCKRKRETYFLFLEMERKAILNLD